MPSDSYGVTDSGFIFPTKTQITEDIQEEIRQSIPTLSFNQNSAETAIVNFMSEVIFDLWQTGYQVFNAQDIQFASGCRLDNLGIRFGVFRLTNESDEQYRLRISQIQSGSGQLSGQAAFDRMYNDLISISGVSDVQINVNSESKFVNGLPPHSFEVMIIGGDNQEIAQTIWRRTPPGITIHGGDDIQITDDQGVCRTIRFTRPFFVPIYIDIRVAKTSIQCGCPTNDTTILVDAVSNYIASEKGVCFTRIGQAINIQDFYAPIYGIQGIGVTCGLMSRDGNEVNQEIINLDRNEVPYFSRECINIEFTDAEQSPCATENYLQTPEECGFQLSLEVTPSSNEFTYVGQVIDYTYTVTNQGSTPISQPILISDNKLSVNCQQIAVGGLAPGESITCSGSYTTTYEDAKIGDVRSVAQAFSGNNFSSKKTTFVDYTGLVLRHSITLNSNLISGSCSAVGNILEFNYTVKNTGNVPLVEAVVITDTAVGSIQVPSIPTQGLMPGQSIVATAKIVVNNDMLNNGELCRRVTALSGTILGSLAAQTVNKCISCGGGNGSGNNPPTPPANVVISDCANSLPYTSLVWTDDTGTVTLSANGTDTARGITLTDNGDNTYTLAITGTYSNGNIVITGTDANGSTATQIVTINCQQSGSGPTPPANIAINNCSSTNFPINTGYWLTDSGPLTLVASGQSNTGVVFTDNGDNSGTISTLSDARTGFISITGTDTLGRQATQTISFSCNSGGGGGGPNTPDRELDFF